MGALFRVTIDEFDDTCDEFKDDFRQKAGGIHRYHVISNYLMNRLV